MACAIELDRIQTGSVTGLIGPNGAGKSTLLRAIAGLQKTTSGQILIQQQNLAAISPKDLATKLAFLPQHLEIVDDFSVSQIISLGRLPHHPGFLQRLRGQKIDFARDRAAILSALNAMHLEHLSQRTARCLSGGELQRAYIARALAQETPILLLDEPTAHLDLKASLELLECLEKRRSQQALTVVIAIHDLNLAALYCHHLLLLNRGQLIAEGTPEQVCQPQTLAAAYGPNLKILPHPLHQRPQILPCRAAQN